MTRSSEDGKGSSRAGECVPPDPVAALLNLQEFTWMSTEDAREARAAEQPTAGGIAYLTRHDIDRLTNYKWRYSLESHGFSSDQAARLLFMRWLFARGRLQQ
jgi:hypothetical protein